MKIFISNTNEIWMISIFFNGRIKTNYFWPFFQIFWTPFWPTSHVFQRMTLWWLIGLYKTSKSILMTHRSGSTCKPWKIEKTSKTSKSVNQLNSNTFEKIFLRKKNFKKFLIFTIFSKKIDFTKAMLVWVFLECFSWLKDDF